MVERPHDVDFLYEAFLALVFTVGRLFREGLHGIVATVLHLFGQVDRCKVSLSYFLLGLELLMEASLVELGFEHFSTVIEVGL